MSRGNRVGGVSQGRKTTDDGNTDLYGEVDHPSWNLDRYFTLPVNPSLEYAAITSIVHMLVLSTFFYLGLYWALDEFGFKSYEFIAVYLSLRAVQIALFSRDTFPTPDPITYVVIFFFNCFWQRIGLSWPRRALVLFGHTLLGQFGGAALGYGLYRGTLRGRLNELPSYENIGDSRVAMFVIFGFFYQAYWFAKLYVQQQANDYMFEDMGKAGPNEKAEGDVFINQDGQKLKVHPDDHRRNAVKGTDFALTYLLSSIVVAAFMLYGFIPDYWLSFFLWWDAGSMAGMRPTLSLILPWVGGLLAIAVILVNTLFRKGERMFYGEYDGIMSYLRYAPDDQYLENRGRNGKPRSHHKDGNGNGYKKRKGKPKRDEYQKLMEMDNVDGYSNSQVPRANNSIA